MVLATIIQILSQLLQYDTNRIFYQKRGLHFNFHNLIDKQSVRKLNRAEKSVQAAEVVAARLHWECSTVASCSRDMAHHQRGWVIQELDTDR